MAIFDDIIQDHELMWLCLTDCGMVPLGSYGSEYIEHYPCAIMGCL